MEPDEEDLIEAWAFEPGWSGRSEEKAQEARRSMEKIKQAAGNSHCELIDNPNRDEGGYIGAVFVVKSEKWEAVQIDRMGKGSVWLDREEATELLKAMRRAGISGDEAES